MEYLHGGDIYRNNVEYDFSVNINPLGMPEGSLRAAAGALRLSGAYPDYRGEELCSAIAAAEQVPREQVILGNGAAELIYALCHALRPRKGLAPAPSFQEYEAAVKGAGGSMCFFPLRKENGFLLTQEILQNITEETDLFFLCNPNNPTGCLTERNFLMQAARKCRETGTWFCLDECFLPFSEEEEQYTMKHMLEEFPNMIILRAFTKIYGMPGLRLGYGLTASKELLMRMQGCLQPWNTSLPAQMAGIEALKDGAYLERTRRLIREQRQYLYRELSKGMADEIYESGANFIFFRGREDWKERLLEQKVLIRACDNFPNLTKGYFRIAVRTPEENKELICRMRKILDMYELFEAWLDKELSVKNLENAVALNFNLYEDMGNAWAVEAVGTSEFDEEDEDWACEEVFDTRENPFSWDEDMDWEAAASRVVRLVKEYLEKGKYAHQIRTYQGIGVGYVDGNIEIVYVNPLPDNGAQ